MLNLPPSWNMLVPVLYQTDFTNEGSGRGWGVRAGRSRFPASGRKENEELGEREILSFLFLFFFPREGYPVTSPPMKSPPRNIYLLNTHRKGKFFLFKFNYNKI